MALIIKGTQDEYVVQGEINSTTSESLFSHFEYLLTLNKTLTINIGRVTQIDQNGVGSLIKLLSFADRFSLKLNIVGDGCKEIYEEYRV